MEGPWLQWAFSAVRNGAEGGEKEKTCSCSVFLTDAEFSAAGCQRLVFNSHCRGNAAQVTMLIFSAVFLPPAKLFLK